MLVSEREKKGRTKKETFSGERYEPVTNKVKTKLPTISTHTYTDVGDVSTTQVFKSFIEEK